MIKKCLEGTRNYLQSGKTLELEYYITKKKIRDESGVRDIYGVEISCSDYGDDYKYLENVYGLSYDKEKVNRIINILIANKVTPIAMCSVIDDLYLENLM